MFDAISIIGNIGVIVYLLFKLFTGGLSSFFDDYIFIGYAVFTTLTLPGLISKVLLNSKFVSFKTAISFLYFPVQFLFIFLLSRISGFSLGELLPFGSFFNIIMWNILFIFFILSDEENGDYSEKALRKLFSAMLPGIIFTIFVNVFIRQQDSVVALDYLQHLTVSNKMFLSDIACILPGQCSNLFLQHGYTTFYHIILGNVSTFISTDPIKTIYVIDVLLPVISGIPLFYIFKDITKSNSWAQFGVFASLLVFVMGGYDFIFFIPQTLAFTLFLFIYREKKLSKRNLLLSSILLIATHFIIGTYMSVFLWTREIILKNIDRKKEVKIYYLLLIISLVFFVLANIAGFSVEKLIQANSVSLIGSPTNPYYPNNLNAYWQILGPLWLFVLIIFITNFLERKVSKVYIESLTYIFMISIVYFLAPTYANKFTIGVGVFSAIMIVKFLSGLNMNIFYKSFVVSALLAIYSSSFYVQYNRYLAFYTQENGTVSAITEEDLVVLDYLRENRTNSYILSDPYTQLIVASLAGVDTIQAQYMSIETRKSLLEYLKDPKIETYENLITSPGIPRNDNFDVLYSSRIYRAFKNQDDSWIYNIYSLNINNSEKIENPDYELIQEMARTGRYPIYISENFILFR